MAGEVVVYGVVVEVKMGGGEISGRERPVRAPAEAHHKSCERKAECDPDGESKDKTNLDWGGPHPHADLEEGGEDPPEHWLVYLLHNHNFNLSISMVNRKGAVCGSRRQGMHLGDIWGQERSMFRCEILLFSGFPRDKLWEEDVRVNTGKHQLEIDVKPRASRSSQEMGRGGHPTLFSSMAERN